MAASSPGSGMAGCWPGCGINQVHRRDRKTSMFYWLGEEFQGQGLAM